MKKFIIPSLILVSALFAGCSDFLAETPESSFTKDEAFKSPSLVYLNTVATIYSAIGAEGTTYTDIPRKHGYLSEFTADLAMHPGRGSDWVDGGVHQDAFLQRWSNSWDVLLNSWNNIFQIIGLVNSSIADLEEIYEQNGEEFVQDYIYELRGVRAYYYYHALNLFARVPIVASTEASVATTKQSERSEVYAFVRDELTEIIPHLSTARCTDVGSEYYGRFTKAVGYMLMAKLAINAPIFSENDWTGGKFTGGIDAVEDRVTNAGKSISITLDGTARNAWETVIYCQEQVAALGYSLATTAKSNFVVGNESSVENIFIRPNDTGTYQIPQRYTTYSINYQHGRAFGGWFCSNGYCATVHCANIFGGKGTYVDDDHPYEEDWSNADPRWDDFFYYGDIYVNGQQIPSGETIAGNPSHGSYLTYWARVNYNLDRFGTGYPNYVLRWGGARVRKIDLDKTDLHPNFITHTTNADMVVYRYADLLLLAAEAKYRNGDADGALTALNAIRGRSGATLKTSVDLQTLLDERALELVWEPTRREDLVRYGMYTEPTEDKYAGVEHASGAHDWVYDQDGIHLVFPIPTDVMALNTTFRQNKGYENNN